MAVAERAARLAPGPWVVRSNQRYGTSAQAVSLAEIPWLVVADIHDRQPIAAAWGRAEADFIAAARRDWPWDAEALGDARQQVASLNAAVASLTDRLRDADRAADARVQRIVNEMDGQIRSLRERATAAGREAAELRARLADAERGAARLRPLLGLCARLLRIHDLAIDQAIPWAEVGAAVEAAGVPDWRDWTK